MADKDRNKTALPERIDQIETQNGSDRTKIDIYNQLASDDTLGRNRYEMLLQLSRDVILFIRRSDTRIVDFNSAALKAYGYSRDELLSLNIGDLRAPQTISLTPAQLNQADQSGILFETIHRRKDGTLFPVEVSSVGTEIESERILISIVRDITARKKTQGELAEANRLLRMTIDAIPDLMFEVDADGRFYSYHMLSGDTLYAPPEVFLGKTVQDVLPAEPARIIMTALAQAVEKGRHRGATYSLALPGGQYWFELSISATPGEKLQSSRYIVLARNITERKRTEESLRENGRLLSESQRIAHLGNWELDICTNEVTWSDETYRIFETDPKTRISYETYVDAIHPDDRDRITAAYARSLKTHEPYEIGYRILLPGGRIKHVQGHSQSFYNPEGKPIRSIGTVQDITERTRSEDALRTSELKYRSLFEAAEDGIILLDSTGFVDCNDAGARMYGISKWEVIGKAPTDFCPENQPDGRPSTEVALEKISAALKGTTQKFDWVSRRPDGTLFDVEITLSRIGDPGSTLMLSIVRDVTDRRRESEKNARLAAQLQQAQKMESVGRLAGGVAHDFNNMLGVILGHTDLALEQVDPEDPINEDLRGIQMAARRSADLTRQLLAFARKQTIALQILDLSETITGALNMLQRLIGENIQLKWSPTADLWPVKADPSQIEQILTNLCVNARDAIQDVGEIVLTAGNCMVDDHYCSTREGLTPGEYVRLEIRDTGGGMEKEVLEHIFEPFFTTKQMGKGTGLGLAMVYGAVRQNSGFIYVASELGYGTTFSIYLPRQEASPRQPAAAKRPARQGKETVLLVEDEPAILNLAARLLRKQGYGVLATKSPTDALRLAAEHEGDIHLLLTDVIMPEMNGRVLADNLRARYPHIKCLFMSGYTADVVAKQGILDEDVSFLQKPFSAEELADKMELVLG